MKLQRATRVRCDSGLYVPFHFFIERPHPSTVGIFIYFPSFVVPRPRSGVDGEGAGAMKWGDVWSMSRTRDDHWTTWEYKQQQAKFLNWWLNNRQEEKKKKKKCGGGGNVVY